jgi:hypothetical protein
VQSLQFRQVATSQRQIRSDAYDPDVVSLWGANPYQSVMRAISLTLLVFALALPAAAVAQDVPPGNSGIDQYQESVPGVGGNRPAGESGSGGSGTSSGGSGTASPGGSTSASGKSQISPSTIRKLDKQGPDGKATAAVAAATAPAPTPARDLGSPGDSGPGMGWVLPVILALALAGALAVVVMRRRGAPPGPA